jgi:hypothetical protein
MHKVIALVVLAAATALSVVGTAGAGLGNHSASHNAGGFGMSDGR